MDATTEQRAQSDTPPPIIELVKAPAELYDWRNRKEGQERFDRGERIIMVNGERWGRTHVKGRGCHGRRQSYW